MQSFPVWLRKRTRIRRTQVSRFADIFFGKPEHRWIGRDKYIRRCFNELIALFSADTINSLARLDIYFIPGDRVLACMIAAPGKSNFVVVYPDLIKLMRSGAPMNAVAVLAHEVGHMLGRHSERSLGTLEAQLEADEFAVSLGLGHELYDVLLDHQSAPHCQERLKALEKKISIEQV